MKRKYKYVTNKNHYDEKAEAITCNINQRKFCLTHDFVNASLHWQDKSDRYSLQMEAPARDGFNYEWGMGYGGIRYCRTCKLLDCIHNFSETMEYRKIIDEFEYIGYNVAKCRICDRRILRSSWGSSSTSPEAYEIIARIAKEMGEPWGGDYHTMPYGSNYYIVLPRETARFLKRSVNGAEDYVRQGFRQGYCDAPRT
jgi:hypothetical protein